MTQEQWDRNVDAFFAAWHNERELQRERARKLARVERFLARAYALRFTANYR